MAKRPFGNICRRPEREGFFVRFRWRGTDRRFCRYAGPSKAHALEKLSALHSLHARNADLRDALAATFGDDNGAKMDFGKAAVLYLEAAAGSKRPSTLVNMKSLLRILTNAPWAAHHLGRIETAQVRTWLDERLRAGASVATANRYLSAASSVFSWAKESGFCDRNPVDDIRRFSEAGRGREVFLTASEAVALVDAAPDRFRVFFLASLTTGCRRSELIRLRWGDVSLTESVLTVQATNAKTKRTRTIPLHPDLSAALVAMNAKALPLPTAPVFAQVNGKAETATTVRKAFAYAVKHANGIADEKRGSLRLHDLRHSAMSFMLAAKVPLLDAGRILGHGNAQTSLRYAHLLPESQRAAIGGLARVFSMSASAQPATGTEGPR